MSAALFALRPRYNVAADCAVLRTMLASNPATAALDTSALTHAELSALVRHEVTHRAVSTAGMVTDWEGWADYMRAAYSVLMRRFAAGRPRLDFPLRRRTVPDATGLPVAATALDHTIAQNRAKRGPV